MADPSTYRPAPGSVPDSPGVYRFRDEHGRVVYVGKAKSLRSRLNSYFADPQALHPRTRTMVSTAAALEWTVVRNEVEALQLEYTWIKEYDPRFNVKYRDDKSYPWLAVTLDEEYPQLRVMRGAKRKGVRYFGPYSHAWAIRETLDLLLRVFPARTCSAGVFKRAGQVGRPCLLGYIDRCSAPCVGRVTAEQHRRIVDDFVVFMSGRTDVMARRLEKEMAAAAADLEFERAARIRDDLGALNRATEKQAVVLPDGTDADVVAFAEDALEAAVCAFFVRGGRVRGQRGWVVDKVEDVTTADLVESFIAQMYIAEAGEVPRTLLVPAQPPDLAAVTDLLERARGGRVEVKVPQRGRKRTLLDTVARNAAQSLAQHKLTRAGDLTTRSRALAELQEALDLPEAPLRIECFDVSNLHGGQVVAGMVVFEDGLPRKSEYRRFEVRSVGGPGATANDVASIHEVVTRRFRRLLDERARSGDVAGVGSGPVDGPERAVDGPTAAQPIDPRTGRPRKFSYPPNLVVVDGGPPQVAAGQSALAALEIEGVALCGLAKRLEEVWLPGQADPVVLPRTSQGLYLLQRVRDEAHRFAISYHRLKRSRAMTASDLDRVPGVGETRRKALVVHFGSVKRLRAAGIDEIAQVPGIGPRTAAAVAEALAARPVVPAVDPRTGEVLDGDSDAVGAGTGAPARSGGGRLAASARVPRRGRVVVGGGR